MRTASTDTRFEPQVRRGPSLTTVIVIGFLLITVVRVLGAVIGGFAPAQAVPTNPPRFIRASDIRTGGISFGTASDGTCGLAGITVTFNSGTEVWWSAHLERNLVSAEAVVVTVVRDGVDVEQDTTARGHLAANGSDVLCAIKPRADTTPGRYVLQVWDATQRQILASGEYSING
jgi:hypothetical protein